MINRWPSNDPLFMRVGRSTVLSQITIVGLPTISFLRNRWSSNHPFFRILTVQRSLFTIVGLPTIIFLQDSYLFNDACL